MQRGRGGLAVDGFARHAWSSRSRVGSQRSSVSLAPANVRRSHTAAGPVFIVRVGSLGLVVGGDSCGCPTQIYELDAYGQSLSRSD